MTPGSRKGNEWEVRILRESLGPGSDEESYGGLLRRGWED